MSQPVKRRSKLPTLTGNKGEELSVAVIHAINDPGEPQSNNNNVVFAPESGILRLHVSAAFGKKNSEKCPANELLHSALLDAFIGFFRENAAPMRIQHVSKSEALEGQNTQTILSLQMFPAPLSRLLVRPQQLKRLESLSVTLAFKASPSPNEMQEQATSLLRSALLTNKKKLSASYSSLVFRAAQNLAKNLASRYPAIFNASWVERLLIDSASYRSISRSITGLLRRPYPAISEHVSSAFALMQTAYPSSVVAESTQDALQYDNPEDPRLYNHNSQSQAANTDNQEAIQKALFALALHQTKRTPLFTDKDPAKEWTSIAAENVQSHHKVSRSRSSSLELEEMPPTKKKKKPIQVPSIETNSKDGMNNISSSTREEPASRRPHVSGDIQYGVAVSRCLRMGKAGFRSDDDKILIDDLDTDVESPPPMQTTPQFPPDMQIDAQRPQDQVFQSDMAGPLSSLQYPHESPSGDSLIETPHSSDDDQILEPPDDDDDEDNMVLDYFHQQLDGTIADLDYRTSRVYPDEDHTPASSSQSTQDSGYTTLPSSQANSQEMNSLQKSWQTVLESQAMEDVESAVGNLVVGTAKADSGDEILCDPDEE